MDCSPPGSSVHRILQARTLECVAMPSPKGSHLPRIEPTSLISSALAGGFFTTSTGWEARSLVRTKEEVLGNKYRKPSPVFSLHDIYSRFIFSWKGCQIKGFLRVGRLVEVCCRLSTIQQMNKQPSWCQFGPGFQHLNEFCGSVFLTFHSLWWKALWSCWWLNLPILPEISLPPLEAHSSALCIMLGMGCVTQTSAKWIFVSAWMVTIGIPHTGR